MYIQVMPKTGGTAELGSQVDSHAEEDADEEELLRKVENAFKACPSIGLLYSEGEVDSEDIIMGLFREFQPAITMKRDIIFDCPCSKDYYIEHIRGLPAKDLEDIRKNGPDPLEVVCRKCGSVYHIPVNEI